MHLEVFDDLQNTQSKELIDSLKTLSPYLSKIFRIMKQKPRKLPQTGGKIHIVVTDDKTICKLNKNFRGKNTPTDVLTFNNDFTIDKKTKIFSEIYISADTAARQARARGISLCNEILILAVHGLVHSAGFDHEISPQAEKQFREYENKILRLLAKHNLQGLISLS